MSRSKALTVAAFAILAGAIWITYSRAIDSPFVFDDQVSVLKNPSITQLWPLVGDAEHPGPLNPPKELPNSGRPLVNLSLALNYHFGQLDTAGYHVFNLFVHILSTFLLMAIVQRTLCLGYFEGRFERASGYLAFTAALLWAVHPLQTEPVVYVTQRTELMVGFFYLATMYASLRYWTAGSPATRNAWLTLAIVACLGGMASKEVMVTAPVIVLLFERTFIAGSFHQALRQSWRLYVGLCLTWGLLFYLHHAAPRSTTAGFGLEVPAYTWWLTQTKVFWLYLKLTLWPWQQSIHYELPYLHSLGAALPWLVPMALLAIVTAVLLWKRNAIGFVGAWVLIILSPTLVVPIITEMAAERRMYLPLAAILTLLVVGAYRLLEPIAPSARRISASRQTSPLRSENLAFTAALLLAVLLAAVSYHRLAAYHDDRTLWQDVLSSQPENFVAHFNLGNVYLRESRNPDAIAHYRLALQVAPKYAEAHNNLGLALGRSGDSNAAIEQFQQALEFKPNYVEAVANMAVAYAALNNSAAALAMGQRAIEMARSADRLAMAQEIEAWLTTYRAHINSTESSR